VYKENCIFCHQSNGEGKNTYFPPLKKSSNITKNPERPIEVIIVGHSGPLVVNGEPFNSTMSPQILNDEEIASVVTYLLNHFDNGGGEIQIDRVAEIRKNLSSKSI
jgi:nitrite reductase (NO-forming)